MSRNDNVTPFRRPPKRPQVRASSGGGVATPRGKAVLSQSLALAAFPLMFFLSAPPLSFIGLAVALAGVFIAASNRAAAMPWARTHHEHALRTIVIGGSIWVLASLLLLLGPIVGIATMYIQIAVVIWVVVRAGVGVVCAIMRRPIARPTGILF